MIVALNDAGTVAYSYELQFREPSIPTRRFYGLLMASLAAADTAASAAARRSAAWSWLWETDLGAEWIPTWEGAGGVATVGRNNLEDSLERKVQELAQEFANAYLAANPPGR